MTENNQPESNPVDVISDAYRNIIKESLKFVTHLTNNDPWLSESVCNMMAQRFNAYNRLTFLQTMEAAAKARENDKPDNNHQ